MPPTHIFLTFIRLTNYKKEKEEKKKKKKRERERERKIEISFNERSITGSRCTRVVENALPFSALRLSLKSVGQLSLCKSYGQRLSYTVKLVEFQKGCCRCIDRSHAQFVPDPTINLGMQWTVEKITLSLRERMRTFVQCGASVACAKCMASSAHQYSRFSSQIDRFVFDS